MEPRGVDIWLAHLRIGSIFDITKTPGAWQWLRANPHTECPQCGGTGAMYRALSDAMPGEMVMVMLVECSRCDGHGIVPYLCLN